MYDSGSPASYQSVGQSVSQSVSQLTPTTVKLLGIRGHIAESMLSTWMNPRLVAM
jgi:hypothetical protein